MGKIIWQKRWLVLAFLLALSLSVGSVAYAVVSVGKSVPASLVVNLEANPEGAFGFYEDSACTIPIAALDFGEARPGITGMASMYVKNLTSSAIFRTFAVSDDLAKGTTSVSPAYLTSELYLGQVRAFDIFVTLDSDISPGVYDFSVTLTGTTIY